MAVARVPDPLVLTVFKGCHSSPPQESLKSAALERGTLGESELGSKMFSSLEQMLLRIDAGHLPGVGLKLTGWGGSSKK